MGLGGYQRQSLNRRVLKAESRGQKAHRDLSVSDHNRESNRFIERIERKRARKKK